MARRQKALRFNLQDGIDIQNHREHRSKRGRNRINRDDTLKYFKLKRNMEEIKQGVDKNSLRLIREHYRI